MKKNIKSSRNNLNNMISVLKVNINKLMDSKNVNHPCQILGWLDEQEQSVLCNVLLHDKMDNLARKSILWYILCHWDMPGREYMVKNINHIKKAYLKDRQRNLHQLCVASFYDYE